MVHYIGLDENVLTASFPTKTYVKRINNFFPLYIFQIIFLFNRSLKAKLVVLPNPIVYLMSTRVLILQKNITKLLILLIYI